MLGSMTRADLATLLLLGLASQVGCIFPPLCGDTSVLDEDYYVSPALVEMAKSDGEITLDECQRLCAAHYQGGGKPPSTTGSTGASTGVEVTSGGTDDPTGGAATSGTSGAATGGSTGASTGGSEGSSSGSTTESELLLEDIDPLTTIIACSVQSADVITCSHELACSSW